MEYLSRNGLLEDVHGNKTWWKNGLLHREDGPAVEWINGFKSWWINGERSEKFRNCPGRNRVECLDSNWIPNHIVYCPACKSRRPRAKKKQPEPEINLEKVKTYLEDNPRVKKLRDFKVEIKNLVEKKYYN